MADKQTEPQVQGTEPPGPEAVKAAETPGPSEQTPGPSAEPETFNQEQVDKLIRASQGTKDKEIAKLTKQVEKLSGLETQLQTAQAALQQVDEARAAQELAAAEGDPDLLAVVKQKHELKRTIDALRKEKADTQAEVDDNKAMLAKIEGADMKELAGELAKEFELDLETIIGFGAETPEDMRKLAGQFSKVVKGRGENLPRPENPTGGPPVGWRGLSADDKILKGVSG